MAEAYLESVATARGNLVLNVILVTDTQKVPHQFVFSASTDVDEIKGQISHALVELSALEAAVAVFTPGPMDLTVEVEDPPSKDAEERAAFAADVERLRQLKRAEELGLNHGESTEALLADLQARFKPEFLAVI